MTENATPSTSISKEESINPAAHFVYECTSISREELIDRAAHFVYEAARWAAQAANAPIIPAPWIDREEPFKVQFRQAVERQCIGSPSDSPEELHNSWMFSYLTMGWRYGNRYSAKEKTHPDLLPYCYLEKREQDKDRVFMALCEIVRQWIIPEWSH